MTTMGFLVFPETIEEWEESIQMYKKNGIAFEKNCKEELEERKQDLLKFLPDSFHSYIYDGSLNSSFPSPQLREMAENWIKKTEEKTIKVLNDYDKYYNSVKDLLPPNVNEIHELGMHDARVSGIDIFNKTCEIRFNDRGLKFIFTNTQKITIPNKLSGRWWLYDEIYLSHNGFELRVLFDDLSELALIAENVLINKLK